MAVESTINCKSIVWNSNTFTAADGGPLRLRYNHTGNPVKDRTGDDLYARVVHVVDRDLTITATLRDVKQTDNLAGSSNLVAILEEPSGDVTMTFAAMTLDGISGTQDRAVLGESEWSFSHASSDGSTNPIT